MSDPDPDPCLIHVLSKEQIDILLKKYDWVKVEWKIEYFRLSKVYLKICSTFKKLETGDDQEEETLLDDLELFLSMMLNMKEIMSKSCEMENAIILMLSNHPWISHQVLEMGHMKLGISNKDCMKLGADSFEEIKSNVFNYLQPRLSNIMGEDDFLYNLNFAQRCYRIDYRVREFLHPYNNSHSNVFRLNLARALNFVVSDWIVAYEEHSKNPCHASCHRMELLTRGVPPLENDWVMK